MGLDYITEDKLPDHKYLKQLVVEDDPENEVVILADVLSPDRVRTEVIRHLAFSELLPK